MLLEPFSQLFRRGCFSHLRQRLYQLVFSIVKVLQFVYIKLSQSFIWHVFSSKKICCTRQFDAVVVLHVSMQLRVFDEELYRESHKCKAAKIASVRCLKSIGHVANRHLKVVRNRRSSNGRRKKSRSKF